MFRKISYFLKIAVGFFLVFARSNQVFCGELTDKSMVFVVPSYNNSSWYESNLNSIKMQNYSNYRVIYVDDCSVDGTGELVEKWLRDNQCDYRVFYFDGSFSKDIPEVTAHYSSLINQERHQFTLVRNAKREGAMCNFFRAVHSCDDHEIVVVTDGDDWLSRENVLSQLNAIYSSDRPVWLTHGTFREYPWGGTSWSQPIPQEIIVSNRYREFRCPSHMRTFYSWLFKRVKLEDFLYKGEFFAITCDMAMMFPMIEMAGERHAFISEVNYIYNMSNPIADQVVNTQLQNDLDYFIRRKERYARLEN